MTLLPLIMSDYLLGLIFLLYADYKFGLVQQQLAQKKVGRRRKTVGKADYQAQGALFLRDEARFNWLLELPESENIGGCDRLCYRGDRRG